MSEYFIYFNFGLLIYLIYTNKKKRLLALPSIHFLIINIISVLTCAYLIKYTNFRIINIEETIHFYSLIYFCSLVSVVKYKERDYGFKFKSIKQIDLSFLKNKKTIKIVCSLSFFNLILFVFFLLSVNLDVLWFNHKYLTMVNIDKLGLKGMPIMIIYQKSLIINGLVSFFLFGLLSNVKVKEVLIPKLIYFGIGLFFLAYQVGNNSRSAGLIIMGLLLPILLLEKSSFIKKTKIVLLLLSVFILYQSVIYGRSQNKQGISQVFVNITNSIANKNVELVLIAENVFGGASTFSIAKDMKGDYPQVYKVLSFSPFPSFIDGFKKYNGEQNVINSWTPYNTNVELFHFGGFYILLYCLLLSIGLMIINKAVRSNSFIGMILAIPAYLFFIAYQQYPLRSYFRFFYISVIMCFIYINYVPKKRIN